MAGIHMRKTKLVLNKPVYTGMTILENSKILMYDFFYNYQKAKYGQKCELIYTDTDSLLLNSQTEDVYKDMKEDSWLYDTTRVRVHEQGPFSGTQDVLERRIQIDEPPVTGQRNPNQVVSRTIIPEFITEVRRIN